MSRRFLVLAALAAVLSSVALPVRATSSAKFPRGNAHIDRVRSFVRFEHPYDLVAMSSDGRYVAFGRSIGSQFWLGVLDLVRDSVKLITPTGVFYPTPAAFSPDGESLLFRVRRILRTIDLQTGARRTIARDASLMAPVAWLSNGRIAYVDEDRRLLFLRPGGIRRDTGFRFAKPKKWYLQASMGVSPNGSQLLYSNGCTTWLVRLATHTRKALGTWMAVPENAWSPDGSDFVVESKGHTGRCQFDAASPYDILYRGNGSRIGVPPETNQLSTGHGISWSNDGNWLFISVQPTGTEVTGYEELYAVDLRTRRVSRVVDERFIDFAFMGPGNWIVFTQYKHANTASTGDESGTVKVGRLVPG